MSSRRSRAFVALIVFYLIPAAFSPARQKTAKACFNIGDTVTIRGHVEAGINAGTYFVPLRPLCVHYPKRIDRFAPQSVTTMGDKLPPNIYVEVTGELRDPWPIFGIGIEVTSFKNVDAEVRAALADWKRACEQWQDDHSPALVKQTHGGTVGRITNEDEVGSLRRCGIAAADTELPHELITIWRPEP